MPLATFEEIVRQTAGFVVRYNLHGFGESLLHPHFVDFVRRVKRIRAHCEVTTNGLLLSPAVAADLVNEGIDSVTFSVDAATAATYASIRGSEYFGRVLRNIQSLVKLRRERNLPLAVSLSFVCVRENLGELPAFVALASRLGADCVFVQSYVDRGWVDDHHLHPSARTRTILSNAEEVASREGVSLVYEYPERILLESDRARGGDLPLWNPDRFPTRLPWFPACEAPLIHGIVRVDGRVTTCWHGDTLGNIHADEFSTIWTSREMQGLRRTMRSSEWARNPHCGSCKSRGPHYFTPVDLVADSVDFGENDGAQLGTGWHELQREGAMTYRFTDQSATVFLRNRNRPLLLLRLCVFAVDCADEEKVVSVTVNDLLVGTVTVGGAWDDFWLPLPRLEGWLLEISLRVDRTSVPWGSRFLPSSADCRRLGVAASFIRQGGLKAWTSSILGKLARRVHGN
jgi:radical SAM protein with 4Fe4S-binding SPASM domain